jgi:hypothetical protein
LRSASAAPLYGPHEQTITIKRTKKDTPFGLNEIGAMQSKRQDSWRQPGISKHTLMEEPKRFSEIQAFIPDLSKRVLNERIKELEECGIVLRNVITDRPIRTEYSLTKKGTDLGKSLKVVETWAKKWL